MPRNRPSLVGRAVVTATAATVLAGLIGPVTAFAAPTAPPIPLVAADRAATALPEATQEEKVEAIRTLGIDVDNTWLVLRDKDFVFKIFDNADSTRFPLVKDGALQAFRDSADATSTVFIRTGVRDLARRDRDNYARDKVERDLARKLKQSAASLIAMPVTDQQLDLSYRDFIYEIWRFSTGAPNVRAGALDAFGATDVQVQKTFLDTGLLAAKRQDQLDAIKADKNKTDAEKAAQAARDARANAASVVLLPVDETLLNLSDDNFIRKVIERAPQGSEVYAAAWAALRSTVPADWTAFVRTGIYEANNRDIDIARKKKAEEDRRVTRELKAKAENGRMQPRLVSAAAAVLAGSDQDVANFLKDGQYAVTTQSLQATTPSVRGWYADSQGGDAWITPGDAGANATAKLPGATWKVVAGLADPNCFSLESSQTAGSYLRQNALRVQLAANDGGSGFKNDATWCSKPGATGSGVTLESKAQPGRFLRHIDAQLWTANDSTQNWCDATYMYSNDITWQVADPDPEVSTPITLRWYNDDAFRAAMGAQQTNDTYDNGVRYRDYQNARVYWSQATGAHFVSTGPVLDKYLSAGGHKLRLPINDTTGTPDGVGRYNHFVDGLSIYWTQATGAHLIYGAIREKWASMDWERSALGYPTTDEHDFEANLPGKGVVSGRQSDFQGGVITWNRQTGEVQVALYSAAEAAQAAAARAAMAAARSAAERAAAEAAMRAAAEAAMKRAHS